MKPKDVIQRLCKSLSADRKTVVFILNAMAKEIRHALSNGESVNIPGLGVFDTHNVVAHELQVAHVVGQKTPTVALPRFTPSKEFLNSIGSDGSSAFKVKNLVAIDHVGVIAFMTKKPPAFVRDLIDVALVDLIRNTVRSGGTIPLKGLGSFQLYNREQKHGKPVRVFQAAMKLREVVDPRAVNAQYMLHMENKRSAPFLNKITAAMASDQTETSKRAQASPEMAVWARLQRSVIRWVNLAVSPVSRWLGKRGQA